MSEIKKKYSIWADNISATYNGKKVVLKDVNLKLEKGEIIALLGPNGAGKSTFFYLLTGMKKANTGKLLIFGKTVKKQCRNNNIAYVPQSEEIDWDYPVRVRDVVLAGRYGQMLSKRGLKKFLPAEWFAKEHLQVVDKALADVDMLAYKRKAIGALSGGQKKRVFLARALAQNAELLLLDEPLVGVDQKSTELIMKVLTKMRDQGKTIVIISHDLNKIQQYAQKIVLLNKTIISVGPTQEILKSPEINTIYNIKPLINNLDTEKEKKILIKNQSKELLSYVE